MGSRIIQLHTKKDKVTQLDEVLKDPRIFDMWRLEEDKDRVSYSLLVRTEDTQSILDKVQTFIGDDTKEEVIGVNKNGKENGMRVIVQSAEAVLPSPPQRENNTGLSRKKSFATVSREELYNNISKGAELNGTFFWLVLFSTITAAIGLLENNVAVIIGAMVIAPLLGPNLALALSTALGDVKLMKRAVLANISGLGFAILLSIALGYVWTGSLDSHEIISRTHVGFDGIILAIVSGAAAVLSLTTGVSSVLVGVMVAVALLPPATTMGVMIGAGNYDLAAGAGLLLAVNIVCVNLSAKIVFLVKGVGPRTWYEKKTAGKAMRRYLVFWVVALVILALLIWLR